MPIEICYEGRKTEDAFFFLEKSRAVLLEDEIIAAKGDQQKKDSIFISIKKVQDQVLIDHAALVEIYSGEAAAYVMLIQPAGTSFNRVNKRDVDSTSKLFNAALSDPNQLNQHYKEFLQTSHHLYRLIFQNIIIPAGRIIVSPDGIHFPVEALVTTEQSEQPVFFLNNYAVSYTYSARFLLNNFNDASAQHAKDFLGIAPVNFPVESGLGSLTGTDNSVKELAKKYRNANTRLFADASRQHFLDDFSHYKIIQLYSHATDTGNKVEPVVYFADSILLLTDLKSGMHPATRLVVLSACYTAKGVSYTGEGVFSFNRAFAALGIPAAISNLWQADQSSVQKMTASFYNYLNQGLPTDIALQQAKLDLIKNASLKEALPYYWAGTILTGKSEKIDTLRPIRWPLYLVLGGFILAVIIVVALRYRR